MASIMADREEIELLVEMVGQQFPWGKVPRDAYLYLQDFPREIRGVILLVNQGAIREPPRLGEEVPLASFEEEKWLFRFVKSQFPRQGLLRRRVLEILNDGAEVPWILPTLFSRWTKKAYVQTMLGRWQRYFGGQLREVNFNEENFPLSPNPRNSRVTEVILDVAMSGPRIEMKIEEAGLVPSDLDSCGEYISENPNAQRDRPLILLLKWQHPRQKTVYVPLFGKEGIRSIISLRPFDSRFASGCAVLCQEPEK